MIKKQLLPHTSKPLVLKRQYGVSLIGLMIGLLISMIAVLGGLSLYKNLTQVSVDATLDSKLNGNVTAALLRARLELQEAGFGLPKPAAGEQPHLVVSVAGDQITWRSSGLGATPLITCKQLIEENDATNNSKTLTLKTLTSTQAAAACSALSDLSSITSTEWALGSSERLSDIKVLRLDAEYSRTTALTHLFSFALGTASCSPFGMSPTTDASGAAVTRTVITINYTTSQNLNVATRTNNTLANTTDSSIDLCIANPVS